ncbi:MAG TPA: DUF6792 domain-containing protein, partial [Lysobacter sp.]
MSLTTLDRAYLAKDAYEDRSREASATDAENNVVQVGGRTYRVLAYVSKPSGYQGTAYRDVLSGEVTIASRGTEIPWQLNRDLLRTDGGMVVKAVNAQADDAIEFARKAIELTKDRAREWNQPIPPITAVGHSLGGSNAQIQAHRLGIRAETFNAYGTAELPIMQGPGKPGAQVVNHMAAGDFVSAASRHFGTQRVYATEADIAHLR